MSTLLRAPGHPGRRAVHTPDLDRPPAARRGGRGVRPGGPRAAGGAGPGAVRGAGRGRRGVHGRLAPGARPTPTPWPSSSTCCPACPTACWSASTTSSCPTTTCREWSEWHWSEQYLVGAYLLAQGSQVRLELATHYAHAHAGLDRLLEPFWSKPALDGLPHTGVALWVTTTGRRRQLSARRWSRRLASARRRRRVAAPRPRPADQRLLEVPPAEQGQGDGQARHHTEVHHVGDQALLGQRHPVPLEERDHDRVQQVDAVGDQAQAHRDRGADGRARIAAASTRPKPIANGIRVASMMNTKRGMPYRCGRQRGDDRGRRSEVRRPGPARPARAGSRPATAATPATSGAGPARPAGRGRTSASTAGNSSRAQAPSVPVTRGSRRPP